MDLGAPLPNQDITRQYKLAVAPLYAQPLAVAVAAVPRATYTFFMCQSQTPLFTKIAWPYPMETISTLE